MPLLALNSLCFYNWAIVCCFHLAYPLPTVYFCCAESAADVIGKLGGVQDILQTMRAYPNDLDIVSDCCTTLWSLSVIGQSSLLHTHTHAMKKA